MIEFNYKNGEIVSSSTVIVSGRTSKFLQSGLVQFVNNQNKVYPPQFYEINNGQFKALLHVSPGEANVFDVHVLDGAYLNETGFPEKYDRVVDKDTLTLFYNPLPENKPVHLCVVVGRDSNGEYDMPKYKLKKGQIANLDTAIQRLKVAARMMQAFTQDEFHRLGLSNRSFQFVEETVHHQSIFGYNMDLATPHQEVKVHVLRSPKTVKELRDPNFAQQNPKASDNGFCFSHAIDLVRDSGLMERYRQAGTAIQCAVMYLDSHWDGKLISTHAALGGGTNDVKMAVFGSHGLHSYPLTFPQVSPSLADATHLSQNEVANDCNECGTSWECLNICLGAFMHEIGHLFGSPHQVDGVMLRDYIWWNRSFMTREAECLRGRTSGAVISNNGTWPKECHWNIMDLMRYLYHDSFSIPVDNADDSFGKSFVTTMAPDNSYKNRSAPTMYVSKPGEVVVKSGLGIFMVEVCGDDLARYHIPYYPKSYGGTGLQHEITLNFDELLKQFKRNWDRAGDNFDLRVLSIAGDLYKANFKSTFHEKDNLIRSDFGLGRGPIDGYKSELLGSSKGDMKFIGFDISRVYKVRVYHGYALDGATFYIDDDKSEQNGEAPPVPARNYLSKMMGKLLQPEAPRNGGEVTIGKVKPHYTEFNLNKGETISKLLFQNGQWIDAMQIHTTLGRTSGMLGNSEGGHLSILEAPSQQHRIVGVYGYCGGWMDGIGIIYAQV